MKPKREITTLVPFYLEEGVLHFFLQKRDAQAPTYAGYFAFFGGGIEEGETHGDAIIREIQEELCINLTGHTFFSRYERPHSINHLFFLKVEKDFASTVTICEGEYGAFLTLAEIIEHEHNGIFLPRDLPILRELSEHLLRNAAS